MVCLQLSVLYMSVCIQLMKDESKIDVVVTTYDALKSGTYITNHALYDTHIHTISYKYVSWSLYLLRYALRLSPLGVAQCHPGRGS